MRKTASLLVIGLLAAIGTYWAFERGGLDFNVFHHAWSLVLEGKGSTIYADSPDRFLYAPGFAWILAPLALLPRDLALALWCFLKAGSLGYVVATLASWIGRSSGSGGRASSAWAFCAIGAFLVARPVLIDFQYGQVNLFILAAAVWALSRHLGEEEGSALDVAAWAALSIAAFAKVFPLPLLLVPLLKPNRKLGLELAGTALGILLIALSPAISQGLGGLAELYSGWKGALLSKGLPTESHNQSFVAMLYHYFSGKLTHVISLGMHPVPLGSAHLELDSIQALGMGWTLAWMGLLLGWLSSSRATRDPLGWIAVSIALVIVPSHLIWKPYFALALPVAALAALSASRSRKPALAWAGVALVFAGMNLTGFDFVGHELAGRLEAASLLLGLHLALIGSAAAAWASRDHASSFLRAP